MPQPIMKKYSQGELGDSYSKKANPKPAQRIDDEFNNKYKLEIATKEIEINLFLFSFSFKKRYPKKTLMIGNMK